MAILDWRGVLLGILATLTMDVLTAAAVGLGLSAPLSPPVVGRWFAAVGRAHLFHVDIAREPPVAGELALAFPVHYAIGITLALLFLLVTTALGQARSVSVALAFGLATNVLPWFLMFPAMGYGAFGAHGPVGTRLFSSSLLSHGFYGLGLGLGAWWIGLSRP